MASVWSQAVKESGPGTKVAGLLAPKAAVERLRAEAAAWQRAAQKRTTKVVPEAMTILLYEDQMLQACLYIEPCSPPSAPEKGQPKREAA